MNRNYLLPCLLALPLAAACSGDGGFDLPPDGPVEAAVGPPLAITSAQACAVESDCRADSVCFQGQCAVADEDTLAALNAMTASGGNPGSIPGLAIEDLPDRVQPVAEGQSNVQVSFTLSAEPADSRLAYRLERDDEPDAPAEVRRASVSGRTVTLTLAAGDADPARGDESTSVYVNVVSAAGTVSVILVPAFPEAGGYAGQAVLNTFGQLGLPISLSVVTDPPGATLEAATAAYLVLPVRPGNLFNPEPFATDGASFVTSALEYDDFARAWVAQFRRPYSLAETSAFGWVESPSNSVTRRMRFELSPNGNGKLVGQISDRWSGLFEQRSSAGVLVPTDVAFEGTVDLQRVAAPPTLADVTPPIDITPQPAGLLPVPVLDQCEGVAFTATATVAGQARACVGITDAASFAMATAQAQADCALAMADASLGAGTTANQIVDFLDEGTPNPGGQSFAEFMQDCVAQTNGTCVPPATVLCSRQLAAHAIKSSSESSPDLIELVLHYQSTTREAFLGRQFGAFYADAQTRLDWLQAQDFPAIVTAAVQSFVAGLLDDWQANVLDAHVGVLRGQFDSAGGAVLGQDLSAAPEANTAQRQLLLETSQSWRSAAEAFALAADRWGTLLTEARARSDKATYVYDRAQDLYVIAGLLAEQNRAAGAGANNAVFAGGFRPLVNATRQLALPFDKLIFERQGEVVISTSLDPMRGNEAILDDLRMQAMMQVSGADEAVTEVLAQAQAELLQQAELTARFVNEADALQSEIANLCGLPMGCTEPDADACAPRVTVGTCGFVVSSAGDVVTAFPDEANPSEAGAAILEVRARSLAWQRARSAYRAHTTKLSIDYANTSAFAERTEQWNVQRLAVVAEAQAGVEQLQMSADAAVQALGDSLAEQYNTRVTSIEGTQAAIKDWEKTRLDGIASDFNRLVGAAVNRGIASSLEREAAIERDLADAASEGLPKATGTANDTTFAARMAIKMTGVVVTRGLDIVSLIAEQAAAQTEVAAARAEAIREAQLTRLEQESDVGSDQVEADVERSRNTAAMIVTASQFEQGIIRETIVNLERELEATLAYERDVQALEDRRADLGRQLAETEELLIQITQAELGVTQAIVQYARAVQRAQLLSGRLATVRNQLDNVNQLLGSPAAVFAWANRLSRAENRLERAKDAVMEWVVALEYFAVRPFFDARIQILLARNTTQLEAIAQELLRLQNACGGAVNTEQVEVSVRKDLLGINDPVEDLRTGTAPTPTERFRSLLREARVPIDKRVRYRSDATVGDLLNRGGILAATFPIDIDEFANLGVSCNAKIQGVAVKLVGEGLGEARPVVSVLYDGTSRLRSCQPNIRSLVDLVGRDLTPFGEVTELEVVGRGVAPVAGVNAFPDNKNISLGGLPLVSQYTVLIDPEAGENAQIDWSKLDDIELRIEYGYQDLFPEGQCQ